MDVKFSIMRESDIEETIELCNICFNEETDKGTSKKIYEQNKEDKNQIYLIGKLNDKIIAHMKISVIPTIYGPMSTYAILNHICVHPDYRRHKIGTHMLDEAKKICKNKNCVCMELWSMNFRIPAHALYKDYGFNVEDAKFFKKVID